MKRKKHRAPKAKKRKAAATTEEPTRRDVLKLARNGAIGTVALGGAGWWAVSGVRAVAAEQDLTRLGDGRPAVIQVHDPQCSLCAQLQRETRVAMKCFEEEDLLFLVANIRTDQGAQFASAHGLPHVTLVLMDDAGRVQQVLQGVRHRDELKSHFQQLTGTALPA